MRIIIDIGGEEVVATTVHPHVAATALTESITVQGEPAGMMALHEDTKALSSLVAIDLGPASIGIDASIMPIIPSTSANEGKINYVSWAKEPALDWGSPHGLLLAMDEAQTHEPLIVPFDSKATDAGQPPQLPFEAKQGKSTHLKKEIKFGIKSLEEESPEAFEDFDIGADEIPYQKEPSLEQLPKEGIRTRQLHERLVKELLSIDGIKKSDLGKDGSGNPVLRVLVNKKRRSLVKKIETVAKGMPVVIEETGEEAT
jgi:hypothetical protein